jgi:hypothetical protein
MIVNGEYKGVSQFKVILQYYFGLTEINHLDFSCDYPCLVQVLNGSLSEDKCELLQIEGTCSMHQRSRCSQL